MADKTGIEWTDATWNPVTGCTKVSAGCDNCYAETFAERWRGTPGHYFEHGFDVQLRPDKLDLPLRWRRPRRIFVNSMSDLFHDQVPDEYVARVWAVMALAPQHTFQVLTKRHARMRSLLTSRAFYTAVYDTLLAPWIDGLRVSEDRLLDVMDWCHSGPGHPHPLGNIWLGVSAENQQWANIRIPALLDTPAAVRFISAEPLLGPIDLYHSHCPEHDFAGGMCTFSCPQRRRIDWCITGGESGPGARPAHPDWFLSIADQCAEAGIAFLHKQNGAWVGQASRADVPRDPDAWVNRETGAVADEKTAMRAGGSWIGVWRVGKKAAGRLLDGQEYNDYPQAVTHA